MSMMKYHIEDKTNERHESMQKENKMSFAAFWTEDPLPSIAPLPGFAAGPAFDWDELAKINHLSRAELDNRRKDGHRPYVARMNGQPAAYGWLATRNIFPLCVPRKP